MSFSNNKDLPNARGIPWASKIQGRQTKVAGSKWKTILWIEPQDMPTEFLGGVLFTEYVPGSPEQDVGYRIRVTWGSGSTKMFQDYESEGGRLVILVPACDTMDVQFFGHFSSELELQIHAILSRDLRVWTGMLLPDGAAPVAPIVMASSFEPQANQTDAGSGTVA